MNASFNPVCPAARSAFAAAAVVVAVGLGALIGGLADHYVAAAKLAAAKPIVFAHTQR